jgi:hypothetical protein
MLEREQLGIMQKTYGSNLVKVYVLEANYSLKEKVLPLFSKPLTKLKHWPKNFPETRQNKSQQKAMRRSAQPSQYFFSFQQLFSLKKTSTILTQGNTNNKISHLNGIIKIIQRELTDLYLQNKLVNLKRLST